MFRFLAVAIALFPLAVPLAAQRVCYSVNAGNSFGSPLQLAYGDLHCVEVRIPANVSYISALEFALWSPMPTQISLSVFTKHPITGAPDQQIGTVGTADLTSGVTAFYGGTLFAGISSPTNCFVCASLPRRSVHAAMPAGSSNGSTFYVLDQTLPGWRGPFNLPWMLRVHAGNHIGAYAAYGAGKPGAMGDPMLRGLGFPNTSNPITLQLSNGPIGAPFTTLLGFRSGAIAIPQIGTLWLTPALGLSATLASGSGGGAGSHNLDLDVPNIPSLQGGVVAAQAFIIDVSATGGVSHSAAVEITIGH